MSKMHRSLIAQASRQVDEGSGMLLVIVSSSDLKLVSWRKLKAYTAHKLPHTPHAHTSFQTTVRWRKGIILRPLKWNYIQGQPRSISFLANLASRVCLGLCLFVFTETLARRNGTRVVKCDLTCIAMLEGLAATIACRWKPFLTVNLSSNKFNVISVNAF